MTSEIIVKVPGGCEHINIGNHFYAQIQGWQTKRICKSLNPALLIDRERNGARQKGRMLSSKLTISCSYDKPKYLVLDLACEVSCLIT